MPHRQGVNYTVTSGGHGTSYLCTHMCEHSISYILSNKSVHKVGYLHMFISSKIIPASIQHLPFAEKKEILLQNTKKCNDLRRLSLGPHSCTWINWGVLLTKEKGLKDGHWKQWHPSWSCYNFTSRLEPVNTMLQCLPKKAEERQRERQTCRVERWMWLKEPEPTVTGLKRENERESNNRAQWSHTDQDIEPEWSRVYQSRMTLLPIACEVCAADTFPLHSSITPHCSFW
jgi:hypothetical protein